MSSRISFHVFVEVRGHREQDRVMMTSEENSVNVFMSANGLQQDRRFALKLDKGENDSQIEPCTTRPRIRQLAFQLVGSQAAMESVFPQLLQCLLDILGSLRMFFCCPSRSSNKGIRVE